MGSQVWSNPNFVTTVLDNFHVFLLLDVQAPIARQKYMRFSSLRQFMTVCVFGTQDLAQLKDTAAILLSRFTALLPQFTSQL